jgi:predicted 2-oxoglutarate/Fe(II)-dependent dioxygenase YbiX
MAKFAGLAVGKDRVVGRHPTFGHAMVLSNMLPRGACEKTRSSWDETLALPGEMEQAYANHLRHCSVMHLDYESPILQVIEPYLADVLPQLRQHFRCQITGFGESWQFCRYRRGDRFAWHLDTGPGEPSTRKISLVIQLSAANAYRGGELEFCPASNIRAQRSQGALIAFPSFYTHRVSRIEAGERFTLVGWLHGRPYE